MSFQTPILFLIYNRPDTTKIVFERIREIKPKFLYIAADGPRKNKPEDIELCKETRELVLNAIDWECDVKTLFRDSNLGCGKAVSSAITWFFENVEMGIIIEDDILADQSFFYFCNELLEKYKNDSRVMTICGSNYIGEWSKGNYSYFYSKYGPVWGWATWKRFWNIYDFDMTNWPKFKKEKKHYAFCDNNFEIKWREKLFDKIYKKIIDTWDYQLVFSKLSQNGLSIIPNHNLIRNIGFGINATHTTGIDKREKLKVVPLSFPLIHNPFIIRDKEADDKYFKEIIYHNLYFTLIKNIVKYFLDKIIYVLNKLRIRKQ